MPRFCAVCTNVNQFIRFIPQKNSSKFMSTDGHELRTIVFSFIYLSFLSICYFSFVVPRFIKLTGSTTFAGITPPPRFFKMASTASCAISLIGCRIVVSIGFTSVAILTSSKPTICTSSGTRFPRALHA